MKIERTLILALLVLGCDQSSHRDAVKIPKERIITCTSKLISDYQSGNLVRQQAVVLEDSILFDVLGIRFIEKITGTKHAFGGEKSVLNRLKRQTKEPHGGAFSWSFILVGDTLTNNNNINYVGVRLLKAGVPEVCVYQMNDLDVKVSNGFTGLNHLRD